MKKAYTKPKIAFEAFVLSCSIAACTFTSKNDERLEFSDGTYFFGIETGGCGINIEDAGGDGFGNGLCYHNPTEGFNFFTS